MADSRQNSEPISARDAAIIRLLLRCGHMQKRIAALFDVNQGRIAEVATGTRQPGVRSLDEQILAAGELPRSFRRDA